MYSAVLLLSTALDTLTVTLPVEIPFTVNLLSSTVAVAMFDCEPSAFKNSMSRYGSLLHHLSVMLVYQLHPDECE